MSLETDVKYILVHHIPSNGSAVSLHQEDGQFSLAHSSFDGVIVYAREVSKRLDVPIVIINGPALAESVAAHKSA
jgi:hypothetical protein